MKTTKVERRIVDLDVLTPLVPQQADDSEAFATWFASIIVFLPGAVAMTLRGENNEQV